MVRDRIDRIGRRGARSGRFISRSSDRVRPLRRTGLRRHSASRGNVVAWVIVSHGPWARERGGQGAHASKRGVTRFRAGVGGVAGEARGCPGRDGDAGPARQALSVPVDWAAMTGTELATRKRALGRDKAGSPSAIPGSSLARSPACAGAHLPRCSGSCVRCPLTTLSKRGAFGCLPVAPSEVREVTDDRCRDP